MKFSTAFTSLICAAATANATVISARAGTNYCCQQVYDPTSITPSNLSGIASIVGVTVGLLEEILSKLGLVSGLASGLGLGSGSGVGSGSSSGDKIAFNCEPYSFNHAAICNGYVVQCDSAAPVPNSVNAQTGCTTPQF